MALQQSPSLADVISDGRWLAQRYDETQDLVHFRFVDRDVHRAASFLKDEQLGDAPIAIFPRVAAVEAARRLDLPPVHFIFHSAYCCSTLLARTLDVPGAAMGMSEPSILTDVIQLQLAGRDRRLVAAVLDGVLTLLARPLGPGELNVIKPSNVVNPLIRAILTMRPTSRAVLLYAPLDSLVASLAAKEIEGRGWARQLMWKLIRLGQVARFSFTEEELYLHTDLQVAALGWLAQHAAFAELAAGGMAVRTLDSEVLLARPADALSALADLFGIEFDVAAQIEGPAFRRHSKDGSDYDASRREAEKAERIAVHRREMDLVVEWARRVADFAAVPRSQPAPLIPDASTPAF